MTKELKRCCGNCGNDIRSGHDIDVVCTCKADGHRIDQDAFHEHWCPRWKGQEKP